MPSVVKAKLKYHLGRFARWKGSAGTLKGWLTWAAKARAAAGLVSW